MVNQIFGFEYLELFDRPNEIQLSNRELHWMLELKSSVEITVTT